MLWRATKISVWLIQFWFFCVCLCMQSHLPRLLCRKKSLEAFWWLVQENSRCQENKQVRCQGAGYHIACCCQILLPPLFFCLRLDAADLSVKVVFFNDSLEVDGICDLLFCLEQRSRTTLSWRVCHLMLITETASCFLCLKKRGLKMTSDTSSEKA